MTKAHFVNHTHWDREWYFTEQDAQVLSDQLFSDVLDELEAHPEANFTLDGQTSIIDEYVAMHPENLERIKQLVARKQLFIGPWYTQTDAMLPDSESIIRNLVIGINDSKQKYGSPMMIGYLPDTFGFNAQLPMLLNQVGIKDFICWRGINFDRQAKSVYFKWKSLGNKGVYVASFPLGYYTGQITLESKENLEQFVEKRLDAGIKFEADNGNNQEVLIPSGIDQMNIIHNVSETLNQINEISDNEVFISSYPAFMQRLRECFDLNEFQGELRYPTYSRVHRTIGSVRSRIKRNNFEVEQMILRRVEPLMVIAQKAGIRVSNGVVLNLWKKLLECQPHDTLGGSVSDNVAEDIDHRFKECFEIAEGIENYIKKRIAQRLKLKDNEVLIFNTDTDKFVGIKEVVILTRSKKVAFDDKYQAAIVEEEYFESRPNIMQQTSKGFEFADEPAYYKLRVQLYVELEPMGYQVVSFEQSDVELPSFVMKEAVEINNEFLKLSYVDGKFNLQSATTSYENIVQILDAANDGDTYDYSPLRGDKEITLDLIGEVSVATTSLSQKIELRGSWELPYDLDDRVSDSPNKKEVPYILTLSLDKGSKVLNGKLVVDNTILSHRLRLSIQTGVFSEDTIAQIQGGFWKTYNLEISDNWEEEFVEKPVNIYNLDKAVGVKDSITKQGVFVFVKGMKEYERVDDKLCVTLMATTGQLGKPNLLWRPGRASGDTTSIGHTMTPTPMAQELGLNTFEFGIRVIGNESENELANEINIWNSPSVSYQMQRLNLFVNRLDNKIWDIEFADDLPAISKKESFLDVKHGDAVVVANYPAYTVKGAHVIRLSNSSSQTINVGELKDQGYLVVNALEETLAKQDYDIEPYDMITLLKKI